MSVHKAEWRLMEESDLADICQVAALCHPQFPETAEVLGEKQQLSPKTCFVLERDGKVLGYLLSHPWVMGSAPALDGALGNIPQNADVLYLHDIAIMPEARSDGAGGRAFSAFEDAAKALGFKALALVAVNHSAPYWQKKGFSCPNYDAQMREKLATYSADALYMTKSFA